MGCRLAFVAGVGPSFKEWLELGVAFMDGWRWPSLHRWMEVGPAFKDGLDVGPPCIDDRRWVQRAWAAVGGHSFHGWLAVVKVGIDAGDGPILHGWQASESSCMETGDGTRLHR